MARRKSESEQPQTGFAFPSLTRASTPEPQAEVAPVAAVVDDAPERPKLRLVERIEEDVTIEATGDGLFWIDFIRHDGTTRGGVRVTRRQLEMLIARAPAALEVGK